MNDDLRLKIDTIIQNDAGAVNSRQSNELLEVVNTEVLAVLNELENKLIHSFDKDPWAKGMNVQEENVREAITQLKQRYGGKEQS